MTANFDIDWADVWPKEMFMKNTSIEPVVLFGPISVFVIKLRSERHSPKNQRATVAAALYRIDRSGQESLAMKNLYGKERVGYADVDGRYKGVLLVGKSRAFDPLHLGHLKGLRVAFYKNLEEARELIEQEQAEVEAGHAGS